MLSLPTQTGRNGVPCKTAELLNEAKKKKEIFLKKLVRLKRSCTFAAAYRDSHYGRNGE